MNTTGIHATNAITSNDSPLETSEIPATASASIAEIIITQDNTATKTAKINPQQFLNLVYVFKPIRCASGIKINSLDMSSIIISSIIWFYDIGI